MLRGELPDRSVVKNGAASQQIIAVPGQPVENVFFLEHGGHLSISASHVIQGFFVSCVGLGRNLQGTVFDLSLDEVIHGGLQFTMPPLFQVTKNVRGSNKIWSAAHSDGGAVGKTNHCQASLSRNLLPVENLGHQRAAQHFFEVREARRIAIALVARLDDSICVLGARAQAGGAGSAARDVERQFAVPDATIPDAPPIARGLALPVPMLRLQITRRHVRVRLDRFDRIFPSLFPVILIDDSQRESFEYGLFEILIHGRRVIKGHQLHFPGQRKVEVKHPAIGPVTNLIIDVTIRADFSPRMAAIYLFEPLIHNGFVY